jgi:hypothetical protein
MAFYSKSDIAPPGKSKGYSDNRSSLEATSSILKFNICLKIKGLAIWQIKDWSNALVKRDGW